MRREIQILPAARAGLASLPPPEQLVPAIHRAVRIGRQLNWT